MKTVKYYPLFLIITILILSFVSCEYFRIMSYEEWVEFKTGSGPSTYKFPPNTVFVGYNDNTTDADGSMERPFNSINFAIIKAQEGLNTIGNGSGMVAVCSNSTYTESVSPKSSISIIGGFTTDWKKGDKTLISVTGDEAFFIDSVTDVVISGFSILVNSQNSVDSSIAMEGSSGVYIRDCEIILPSNVSLESYGIYIDMTSDQSVTIENCTIDISGSAGQSSTGIYVNNSSNNLNIRNNKIYNSADVAVNENIGISISSGFAPHIDNNIVTINKSDSNSAMYGISINLSNSTYSSQCNNNRIALSGKGSMFGIYVIGDAEFMITNNCIYIDITYDSQTYNYYGIYADSATAPKIYNNMVYIYPNSNLSTNIAAMVYFSMGTSSAEIANNILYFDNTSSLTTPMSVTAIYAGNGSFIPGNLRNNIFYIEPDTSTDQFAAYYKAGAPVVIVDYNSDLTVDVSASSFRFISDLNNKFLDPIIDHPDYQYNDPDWMRPGASSVYRSGYNLTLDGYSFPDINGVPRGSTWSVGPYQE